jgi:hypothetical protein
MAGNLNDIISALPAAGRRKIEKRAHLLISEDMSLQELRRARDDAGQDDKTLGRRA